MSNVPLNRANLSAGHFIDILTEFNRLIVAKVDESSMSTSTDRATSYLERQGLRDHIRVFKKPISEIHRVGQELSGYGIENISVERLEITFDKEINLNVHLESWKIGPNKWMPVEHFNWHFKCCRFSGLRTSSLSFTWARGFRFDDCSFLFKVPPGTRNLALHFGENSDVVFSQVDFGGSRFQIQTHESALSIELYGNCGIDMLSIFGAAKHFRLNGTNHVSCLSLTQIEYTDLSIVEIGAFEQIDRLFQRPDHHRQLFLELRRKASEREDSRQVNILDAYIDEIDYCLLKAQRVRGMWRRWLYLQKRALYWLRKWTSNFHRSWFRPVSAMIIGYAALNILPPLFVESTTVVEDWLRLCANPLSRTSEHMEQILGKSYTDASGLVKIGTDYVSLSKILWLAGWGIVFRKVLRLL